MLKIGFPFYRKYPSGRFGFDFTRNETDPEKYMEYVTELKNEIESGTIYVLYPWNLKSDHAGNEPTVKMQEPLKNAV